MLATAFAGTPVPEPISVAGTQVYTGPALAQFQDPQAVRAWIERSAGIVAAYYGGFPVRELRLTLEPEPGAAVDGGTTFADPAARIRIRLGREASEASLSEDWVLVHEMTHLALPDTGESHAWLSEGIATYVEGVARVQAGNRTETDMWAEELRAMPRGMPGPDDAGLDRTHTWGRTYWGGAMFCLMADVGIRTRTQNRLGLQDALRAILAASGGLKSDWTIERVLKTGDAAVGVPVLEELYRRYALTSEAPDLEALWRDLGVTRAADGVRLSDTAPLAAVRHAILSPR
ncbi:MAG: hypothetical protein JSS29_11150 [Proteobacteria bacterium]|nr:hypothetical protein [Pseudomonadota bacterium]